jgi:lactoylglutathione lyase
MSAVPAKVGAITLFVGDAQRSKAFYERVFEIAPVNEEPDGVTFRLDSLYLNILATPSAHELIGPAVVGSPDSGARFQLTIWVEDAEAAVEALESRGIAMLNGPIDRPWSVRTAAFADPDGHVWELGQALPAHGSG